MKSSLNLDRKGLPKNLDKLFHRPPQIVEFQRLNKEHENSTEPDQLLTITFALNGEFSTRQQRDQVYELEDKLEELLTPHPDTNVDGHGFGDSEATLYIYGNNTQTILNTTKTHLTNHEFKPFHITTTTTNTDTDTEDEDTPDNDADVLSTTTPPQDYELNLLNSTLKGGVCLGSG